MDTLSLVYTVGESLIAALATVGNGIVFLAIVRSPRLRANQHYYVASLCMSDILVGVVGIPCAVTSFFGHPYNFTGCLLMNSMIVVLTQISIFGLLAIAVDRFLAVSDPYRYQQLCTPRVTAVLLVCVWVSAILVGVVPVFGWNLGAPNTTRACAFTETIDMNYMVYFNFFGFVLTPLVLMMFIYLYIYSIVRRQVRSIAALHVSGAGDKDEGRGRAVAKESKAAKWFAFVLVVFAVCWLPIHIMNTITLLAGRTHFPSLIAAILFSHFNSTVNPFIYAFSSRQYVIAIKQLFGVKVDTEDSGTGVTASSKY